MLLITSLTSLLTVTSVANTSIIKHCYLSSSVTHNDMLLLFLHVLITIFVDPEPPLRAAIIIELRLSCDAWSNDTGIPLGIVDKTLRLDWNAIPDDRLFDIDLHETEEVIRLTQIITIFRIMLNIFNFLQNDPDCNTDPKLCEINLEQQWSKKNMIKLWEPLTLTQSIKGLRSK